MKKFVTSMLIFIMLFSLSMGTFAEDVTQQYFAEIERFVEYEHVAVGGPNIGGNEDEDDIRTQLGIEPRGLIFVKYNEGPETITGTLYKVLPWENNFRMKTLPGFPDDVIQQAIRDINPTFEKFSIRKGYIWGKFPYEIPPGKTLVMTATNEYQILRTQLRILNSGPDGPISEQLGYADVRNYIRTIIEPYILQGKYTKEEIIDDPLHVFY